MKQPIFHTQRKKIFCTEDGKGFLKMISEGVFKPLSDEEGEAFENEGLTPNGVYEIQITFDSTVQKIQEFLNENEDKVIKINFVISDDLDCFLHKSFATVLNDLKCKGIETVNLNVVGVPYVDNFETEFN